MPDTASSNVVAYTWSSFTQLFAALKDWVGTVIDLLDNIILLEFGNGVQYSMFDFGISLLAMSVILIIYLRLRH